MNRRSASVRSEPFRYGLFLQSSHPPERALGDSIDRVLEQIRWADELGFSEAWLGEHLTAAWEPIPAQDLVIAQALTCTQHITLCAGAYVLPFYHPAALAMRISQLDHMARGRFLCGIAAGSIPTDLSMLDVDAAAGEHRERMQESLEIMLRIWNEPFEPWTIEGRYWTVRNPEPTLRYGPHIQPYQKPHPPIALAGLSPNSGTLELAGARGFIPLSLTFNTPYLEGHWSVVERGAASTGRPCDRRDWRVVRDVFVAESDAEARKWVREGNMARAWREQNFPTLDQFGWRQYLKHDERVSDSDVDIDYLIEHLFLVGSPETVARRLFEVDAALGGFGTVVLNAYDWADDSGPYRRSMELFAEEVIPRVDAMRRAEGVTRETS
jgi:alkanesulfonate monooxygenase SsuD/methylene tetrahydromethanopterin reductase-like flavin-dependent oxidoreductase (luciferase family)